MKKFSFLLLSIFFLFGVNTYAQTVKGQVVDEANNQTIPGATVYVKGTNIGTITDLDGNFELTVEEGISTLKIASIGYIDVEQDINVEGNDVLDLEKIYLSADAIGLEEVKVFASFAVDRKTPIAVSTIDPVYITEKLGSQEFPEILKTTPSIYVTKQGGGYGDSRINLRGFDSRNVGILINGVPVNDMETGKVYWSNWAGLSDVTRTMQVQRGIGASKLAISSVGGTINILTKTTDMEKGGSVYYGIGNNGYNKLGFTVSTGMYDNGWAVTLSGSHTEGDGYVRGTNFDAWSYYFNVSKRLSDKSQISFNIFGAPQWHNQRSSMKPIEMYRTSPYGIQSNWDYGFRNGEIYPSSYAYNFYHKPVISLNHFWKISNSVQLNTVLYSSNGRGGGRRIYGESALLTYDRYSGQPTSSTLLTNDGYIDFDAAAQLNKESLTGSRVIIANSNNSHDWYGILSTLKADFNNFTFTGGIDGRYYKGYHFYTIDDLLGGNYFLNSNDVNRDPSTPLYKGDIINYHNLGEVLWLGLFSQIEYSSDNFASFLSVSASNTGYRRTDYFNYTPEEGQTTDWFNMLTYSVKGGANYNITDQFNVFVNGGYFTRPPYFKYVYLNYKNILNPNVQPEKVITGEAGIGYKSQFVKSSIYGYYTLWLDKSYTVTSGNSIANLLGIDANHKGIEFVAKINPVHKLNIGVMASVGDWQWINDAQALYYDIETGQPTGSDPVTIYAKGIHVSDAAQTTGALTFDWGVFPRFKIGGEWVYYDRLYARFDVEARQATDDIGIDAWKMPSYSLLDLNFRHDFVFAGFDATLYGNMNNVLDTEYISDAKDGNNHDAASALVYYGFGRTWNLGLRFRF